MAIKLKGVTSASWDMNSKILQLTYNPARLSLEKIQDRIVAAGHDLDNKKAKDSVYRPVVTIVNRKIMAQPYSKRIQSASIGFPSLDTINKCCMPV